MYEMRINADRTCGTISRHLYGHFAEHLGRGIYEGIYVGPDSDIPNVRGIRKDVAAALRHIRIPNLRWPGGCFADEYHWRDGIGPKETRKRMVNTHWGGLVEDNSFGTHEFLDLCEQLDCAPYINGNLGSGTVQEMQEWVEYITFGGLSPMSELRRANGRDTPWSLPFFGIGNENWGCGGNMRPQYYADTYRRYQTYVRELDGNRIVKIACGPSDNDYAWTQTLMREAGRFMHGLSLHYYTIAGPDWQHKGPATGFDAASYYHTLHKALRMDTLVGNHLQIMHRYDPSHRVGLVIDEWGTWYDVEPGTNPGFLYQQNTMRDAMVASATLDIFNRYASRILMANIAQLVNVLQALILTDGPRMLCTPTYHVFDLYKGHHDAKRVEHTLVTDIIGTEGAPVARLDGTASVGKGGGLYITLSNRSDDMEAPVRIALAGIAAADVQARIVSGGIGDYNDFDRPNAVAVRDFEGVQVEPQALTFTLPPCAVVALEVRP